MKRTTRHVQVNELEIKNLPNPKESGLRSSFAVISEQYPFFFFFKAGLLEYNY